MHYDKTGVYLTRAEFFPLKDRYIVKNLKKLQAMKMELWGWRKLPDEIKHYSYNEETQLIKVPNGLRGFYEFKNNRGRDGFTAHPVLINKYKGNEQDLFQDTGITQLLKKNVGLLHGSTGIGKSIVAAKIIDKLQIQTLVIVKGITLMTQLKKDFRNFFGVECRTISGTKKKQAGCYERIVIANIDSIIKYPKEYVDGFGLIICDEVDCFLQSEKRLKFIGELNAKYIYGMTGTIKLNHVDNRVFPIYLGPTTELLLKYFTPTIYKVLTDFKYQLDDLKEFYKLKEELYYNEDRNNLIIETIVGNLGLRKGIVFSEYVGHAKLLKEKLENKGIKCFLLIGEVKKDEREKVKQELKEYKGACVLIGSVKIIGRGFDVSELSIGFLTTAEKFISNIFQYVGRIIRNNPGKKDCIWFDFVDTGCTLLANQAKSRTVSYKKEFPGCKINFM